MINKVLFFVIFLFLFNSCIQNKKTEDSKINDIPVVNNAFIETDENHKSQILSFIKNRIAEGFYAHYLDVIYLSKNENTIKIQGFNKINDDEIFTEIVTFDILHNNITHEVIGESYNQVQREITTRNNENIYTQLNLITEKRRFISGYIDIRKKDYGLNVSSWYDLQFLSPVTGYYTPNFEFLSGIIDENVNKYTYDFQKQYIGTYIYDSFKLINIKPDEFTIRHEDEIIEKIISIDESGWLFLDDGFGMPFYTDGIDGWKTKVISNDEKATLFGNTPAYGTSVHLYFLACDIIWEVDFGHDDIKYQLVFRKE
jgi:hypothetical protein